MKKNILDCIGNTPLIELEYENSNQSGAKLLVKLEMLNPTGSMKDRMALSIIEEAEKCGKITLGDSIVECSSGSTGSSLTQVCTAKGYPITIVTSDAFSSEKLNHMRALGADLILIPSKGRGITKQLFQNMIDKTFELSQSSNVYWPDQMHNQDMLLGYKKLGCEIWNQTKNKISCFVHAVGSCGSLRGVSTQLREFDPSISICAVEPTESAVLSGGPSGSHSIEGIGAGFVVDHWSPDLADRIVTVSSDEANNTALWLAKKHCIFSGPSSGANVAAAIKVAKSMSQDDVVVTLLPDSGFKYLSTPLYS